MIKRILIKTLTRIPMDTQNTTIWGWTCYPIKQIMDTKRHKRISQLHLKFQEIASPVIRR